MRKRNRFVALGVVLGAWASCSAVTMAHGIVGNRFFPPTLATDDPFAVDEFALPEITYVKNAGPASRETDLGFEFDKEIFPGFALGISDTYISQKGAGRNPSAYGWSNLDLTAKQQLWQNNEHEEIVSVGIEADVGRTGGRNTSDTFSVITPNLYLGKGFGDLPDSVSGLQPFAVTSVIGEDFPTSADGSNALEWGFAVEYSLPYLQQHVRDVGLPAPLRDMVPLVEFAMTTNENRQGRGQTTGTVDPGVLWITDYYELGVEANVPVNAASGAHVGVNLQLWIFIDDLFPKVFGHPLFGAQP
jgi:hypothetical protein